MKHIVVTTFARLSAVSEAQPATCWPELSDLTLIFDRLCIIVPSMASMMLANSLDRIDVGVVHLGLANDPVCTLSQKELSDNERLPKQSIGSDPDGVRVSATKRTSRADIVIGIDMDLLIDKQFDCLQFGQYTAIMPAKDSYGLCDDCNAATFLPALAATANCSKSASLSEFRMDHISTTSRDYCAPGLSFVIKEVL